LWLISNFWNPIKRFSLVRNEVKSVVSSRAAKSWQQDGGGYLADEDRTQRHALILRDVAYIIKADIALMPHATDPLQKYTEIFDRRVEKGQAHRMPYLGNREFSANFSPLDGTETPILETNELGRMLFDLEFTSQKKGGIQFRQHNQKGASTVNGVATPKFFRAKLERGILKIPPELYGGT
jgi:CRISPR-associated protein Cas5d